jgi:hypothetical protein
VDTARLVCADCAGRRMAVGVQGAGGEGDSRVETRNVKRETSNVKRET